MKRYLMILIFCSFGFILGYYAGSKEDILIDEKEAAPSPTEAGKGIEAKVTKPTPAIADKEDTDIVHGEWIGETGTLKLEESTVPEVNKQAAPSVNVEQERESETLRHVANEGLLEETSIVEIEEPSVPEACKEESTPAKGEQERENKSVEYTFKRGDSFYSVLLGLGIAPQEVFSLIESSKGIHDLKRVSAGTTIKLEVDPVRDTVTCLEFSYDNQHMLVVTKTDQGYAASKEKIVFDTRIRTVGGVIKSNLYEDATKAGCSPQLILSFADVFAWDIDFFSDLRKNDRFRLVFEEMYKDGEFVKYGKILAAQFINRENPFLAFYFECGNGEAGYYDEEGKSVAREFLKSLVIFNKSLFGAFFRVSPP